MRDLLKTASRQAASYLGQVRATEALLEARKFDAFNRMSAFVVHDLKNLVAQLSLMLKNAERHRDNPEFQADMLTTVEHVVERMNGLMLQLRTGAEPVENPRHVDLGAVVATRLRGESRSARAHRAGVDVRRGSGRRTRTGSSTSSVTWCRTRSTRALPAAGSTSRVARSRPAGDRRGRRQRRPA